MFKPQFIYTNKIVNNLLFIERCRNFVDFIKPSESKQRKIKEDFILNASYFSCRMEGSPITYEQAQRILADKGGQVLVGAEQEVRNYRDALEFLADQKRGGTEISIPLIKRLNFIICTKSVEVKGSQSQYRKAKPPGIPDVVYDRETKEARYIPPDADEVHGLMEDLMTWFSESDDLPVAIKAAILDHQLQTIHPFELGSGSTARALTAYYLSLHGCTFNGAATLEEFYGADIKGYYKHLEVGLPPNYYGGRNHVKDMGPWIAYFTDILKAAFEKTVSLYMQQSRETKKHSVLLTEKDKILLNHCRKYHMETIRPGEIAELYGVTPRAVLSWIPKWIEKGFLEPKTGSKRITSYTVNKQF